MQPNPAQNTQGEPLQNNGAAKAVTTAKSRKPWQFQPGQSGNPKGRPKGARHRLGEAFLEDLQKAWKERGRDCIERAMDEKPADVLRVIAALLPKQAEINISKYDEMEPEQLVHRFRAALIDAAAYGITIEPGDIGCEDQAGEGKPTLTISAVPEAEGIPQCGEDS